jgi:hypothetical protein
MNGRGFAGEHWKDCPRSETEALRFPRNNQLFPRPEAVERNRDRSQAAL